MYVRMFVYNCLLTTLITPQKDQLSPNFQGAPGMVFISSETGRPCAMAGRLGTAMGTGQAKRCTQTQVDIAQT